MDNRSPSMLKSTLIGGAAFGVAGAIPVVNFLNVCCCALVIGAGFLAAFLYSRECRDAGVEFRPGNGALIGLVAGMFYAVTGTVVSLLIRLVIPAPDPQQMADLLQQFNLPPESVDMAMRFMEGSTGVMGIIIGFFAGVLIGAIFSTIGGLIGGAVFKVEVPAPPTSTPPPPPPAP